MKITGTALMTRGENMASIVSTEPSSIVSQNQMPMQKETRAVETQAERRQADDEESARPEVEQRRLVVVLQARLAAQVERQGGALDLLAQNVAQAVRPVRVVRMLEACRREQEHALRAGHEGARDLQEDHPHRREEKDRGERHGCHAGPVAAQKAALEDDAVQEVEGGENGCQPRRVVDVDAEADREAGEDPIEGAPLLRGADDEIEHQHGGEKRLHVVDAGAAEVDVPVRHREEEGRHRADAAREEPPREKVQQHDGERPLDHRRHAESPQVVAEDPHRDGRDGEAQVGDVIPADGEDVRHLAGEDAARFEAARRLVAVHLGRNLRQVGEAESDGDGDQREHGDDIPAPSRVGRRAPPAEPGRRRQEDHRRQPRQQRLAVRGTARQALDAERDEGNAHHGQGGGQRRARRQPAQRRRFGRRLERCLERRPAIDDPDADAADDGGEQVEPAAALDEAQASELVLCPERRGDSSPPQQKPEQQKRDVDPSLPPLVGSFRARARRPTCPLFAQPSFPRRFGSRRAGKVPQQDAAR